jgi:hypothetical protein
MFSQRKLSALALAMFALIGSWSAKASEPQAGALSSDKYQAWRESVASGAPVYRGYYSSSKEDFQLARPGYNGWMFFLANYNQETFRTITETMTKFETNTVITTNTNVSSDLLFNSYDLFNTIVTSNTLGASEWVSQRADYLRNNFGLSMSEALTTAMNERSVCESDPKNCVNLLYTTNYKLDNIYSTSTTVNPTTNSSTSSSSSSTATSSSGNTTVTTTTTTNSTTNSTTTSSTETTTSGTVDTLTVASGASGGSGGSVDTQTTSDERITIDEATSTETTSTTTTETKTDKTTVTEESKRIRGERNWEFQVSPLIFFSWKSNRSIFSLDRHYPSVSSLLFGESGGVLHNRSASKSLLAFDNNLNEASDRIIPELKVGDQAGPYRVELRTDVVGGLGAILQVVLVNGSGILPNVIPYVGVAPMGGKTTISERTVKSAEDARKVKALSVPKSAEDLKSWAMYDKLAYSTQGGVLFVAGVSMPGLNAGVNHVINGTWDTEIRKFSDSHVYVKVSNSRLKTLSAFLSASIVQVNTTSFQNLTDAFSFMFNLRDQDGLSAYLQLLKGNARNAQKLAESESRHVLRIETSAIRTAGKMRGFTFGIANVASVGTAEGEYQSAELSDYHPDQTKVDADYGIYMKEKNSQFFGDKTSTTFGFYGAAHRKSKGSSVESGTFGSVGWAFRATEAQRHEIQKAVQHLVDQTGLKNELMVKLGGDQKLSGNANIDFSLSIDENATHLLLELARQEGASTTLTEIADGFLSSVMKTGILTPEGRDFINRLMSQYIGAKLTKQPSFENNKINLNRINRAKAKISSDSKLASEEMVKQLRAMSVALAKNDRKAYVIAYAQFGKAMIKNPFTFQTVFNLIKGRGASVRYTITGEHIKSYELYFDWKPMVSESLVARQ